jgi:ATP-dependent DNA helicase RecQ
VQKKSKLILSDEILNILSQHSPQTSLEICHQITANEKDILIHLQQLLAAGKIGLNHLNKFYLIHI